MPPKSACHFNIPKLTQKAHDFADEWKPRIAGKHLRANERALSQSFITDIFAIFDMKPLILGKFEYDVLKFNGNRGFIDYLSIGWLGIEMKKTDYSNLQDAWKQLLDYCTFLPNYVIPQTLIVSDMKTIEIMPDRTNPSKKEIVTLDNLTTDIAKLIPVFEAIYDKYKNTDVNAAVRKLDINWMAAFKLAELHRHLRAASANEPFQKDTAVKYMTRFLFLLYAQDCGLLEQNKFGEFVVNLKDNDGYKIKELFNALNTENKKSTLPYLNGGLFRETLPVLAVDVNIKKALCDSAALNWSNVSPVEFGTFFQNILDKDNRAEYGTEFTETDNLLKIINPLFLDDLQNEFETAKESWDALETLHNKIAALNFLDPACGSGNFLSESYVALRELELDIIAEKQTFRKIKPEEHLRVKPKQFHGIEIQPDAAEIGAVSMWILEHRMNQQFSIRFDIYPPYAEIPLGESVNIKTADSLSADWNGIFGYDDNFTFDYILGNPPYSGGTLMTAAQKKRIQSVIGDLPRAGNLDLVSGWFVKAAEYMQTHNTKTAFLATNSICQGDQVAPLWEHLFDKLNCRIQFAYPSFKWQNRTSDVAAVIVIIIGFVPERLLKAPLRLFIEEPLPYGQSAFIPQEVKHINAYLRDAPNVWIYSRSEPITKNVPQMIRASDPNDDGLLSKYTTEKKNMIVSKHPETKPYWRQLISSGEMLNGKLRWCLWFHGCKEKDLRKSKFIRSLLNQVRDFRLRSKRPQTKAAADTPHLFGEIRQPDCDYLVVPRVSSERRQYIPIAFFRRKDIVVGSCQYIPDADNYLFGILSSSVHNEWMRLVAGRLKLDYRHSVSMVYNNFPFPKLSAALRKRIEAAAENVLKVRKLCTDMTLAQMYSNMPPALQKAHNDLDTLVLSAYDLPPDASSETVIEKLFERYNELV